MAIQYYYQTKTSFEYKKESLDRSSKPSESRSFKNFVIYWGKVKHVNCALVAYFCHQPLSSGTGIQVEIIFTVSLNNKEANNKIFMMNNVNKTKFRKRIRYYQAFNALHAKLIFLCWQYFTQKLNSNFWSVDFVQYYFILYYHRISILSLYNCHK